MIVASQGTAHAQNERAQRIASAQQQAALRTKLNESTLLLVASHPGASYLGMARDIATVVSGAEDIRLLTIAGDGGVENLRDLLFLRGADLALVPANVLAHAKSAELLGSGLPQRVAYITRLYSEEVHLLAGRSVRNVADLSGKKVGVALDDGNAQFTAGDIFRRLGIEAETVKMNVADAIDRVRSGELGAALFIGGKPLPFLSHLPKDGSLQLLELPLSQSLEEGYSPAAFRSDDYPVLIPPGVTIETVSVAAVLLANNTRGNDEAARRIAKFIPAFFGGLAELGLSSRHPKWTEVNLAAPLPGWTRVDVADEWLANARDQQTGSLQRKFEEFLRATHPSAASLSPTQRRKLFEDFVGWTRKSVREVGQAARR